MNKNLFVLLIADVLFLTISYILAYMIRFEAQLCARELLTIKQSLAPIIATKLIFFYFFGLYRGMWRYTGLTDLLNIIKAVVLSSIMIVIVVFIVARLEGFSRSVFVIDTVFSLISIGGIRILIRLFLYHSTTFRGEGGKAKRLIIVGAGDAGEKVFREINDNPFMKYKVIGFVDDEQSKVGKYIHGVKVIGRINDLAEIVKDKEIDEMVITIPSASGSQVRRIVELCEETRTPYKILPGMGEILDGKVSIKRVRDISYKDLLGRSPVRLENDRISEFLKEKRIMVTGAGGSIGSELCRQICRYGPGLIILFDASESNLYSIQMELKHAITYVKYRAVLGRVQDARLVNDIFIKYQPDVVFHAAAYKHVPLIERNPWEAVYSNKIGTKTIMEASLAHQTPRFVLVSTDKAVRPTNVMGASKRVTEKIVLAQHSDTTRFMAVRFGNVVG
ncbi:MAG: polysaccharide biosynthesis protein, partial [Pseudomonadota bacterium]